MGQTLHILPQWVPKPTVIGLRIASVKGKTTNIWCITKKHGNITINSHHVPFAWKSSTGSKSSSSSSSSSSTNIMGMLHHDHAENLNEFHFRWKSRLQLCLRRPCLLRFYTCHQHMLVCTTAKLPEHHRRYSVESWQSLLWPLFRTLSTTTTVLWSKER